MAREHTLKWLSKSPESSTNHPDRNGQRNDKNRSIVLFNHIQSSRLDDLLRRSEHSLLDYNTPHILDRLIAESLPVAASIKYRIVTFIFHLSSFIFYFSSFIFHPIDK